MCCCGRWLSCCLIFIISQCWQLTTLQICGAAETQASTSILTDNQYFLPTGQCGCCYLLLWKLAQTDAPSVHRFMSVHCYFSTPVQLTVHFTDLFQLLFVSSLCYCQEAAWLAWLFSPVQRKRLTGETAHLNLWIHFERVQTFSKLYQYSLCSSVSVYFKPRIWTEFLMNHPHSPLLHNSQD